MTSFNPPKNVAAADDLSIFSVKNRVAGIHLRFLRWLLFKIAEWAVRAPEVLRRNLDASVLPRYIATRYTQIIA
jgi:hypothetical protein